MKTVNDRGSYSKTVRCIMSDAGAKGRRILLMSAAVMTVTKLMLAYAPLLAGKITDELAASMGSGAIDTRHIWVQCALLALLFLLGYGADGFINRGMVRISQSLICGLRNRALQKLSRLPLSYIDSHPAGDILSRVTNDVAAMSTSLESTLSAVMGQVILLAGLTVMMIVTNVKLALVYLIILPAGLGLLGIIMKRTGRLFRLQNETLGGLSAHVSDTYSNHLLMKAYGCEQEKLREFEEHNSSYYGTYLRSRFLSGFVIPMAAAVNSMTFIALCILGGLMLIRGALTIGEFQAFIFYGNMIGTPLTTLSTSMNNIQTGLTAAERLYGFLDEPEEADDSCGAEDGPAQPAPVNGRVEFSHVSFGYSEDRPLMKDVSFTAEPGQIVAIAGPSGAGKTTMVNLLMRFYDIWGGSIRIDGADIREMPKKQLRGMLGMVLQDPWIFDGTVAENIGYGDTEASMEEIVRAAQLTHCDSLIRRIPGGYDAHISGETSTLSEGEKQLLTLARVVMSDPEILILDEATSMVDTGTEEMITRAMERMMEGRTALIIAHRLYTIRNADIILYVENGDITEAGSHDELMKKNGSYAKMYAEASLGGSGI